MMFEDYFFVMVEGSRDGKGEAKTLDTYAGFKGLMELHADMKIREKVQELRKSGASQIWIGYNIFEDSGLYSMIYYRSDGDITKDPDMQVECFIGNADYYKKVLNLK